MSLLQHDSNRVNTIRYDERFGFWDSQEQTADQTRIIYVYIYIRRYNVWISVQ